MRKKIEKIRLAEFANINTNTIVEAHIARVTAVTTTIENWNEIPMDNITPFNPVYKVVKAAKPAPQKTILYHKYIFLIHIIIMSCRANKKNQVHLNYKQMTDILGDCYGDMLYTLEDIGIISMTTAYIPGVQSRTICLNIWDITFQESSNIKVIKYHHAYKQQISKCKMESSTPKDDEFIANYNESLSYIDLNKRDEAISYINNRTFDSPHSYHYYVSRIEDFNRKNNHVISIDNNNRIYHYFTNLPKSLKSFFNINYQLDISNSHPLLFSYYLIKHYNINNDVLNILYNYIGGYNDHNVSEQLCKALNIKKINIPNDVLDYIYTTSKGRFWDDFIEVFKTMNRGEVKATLFREVFYSHSTTTRNKDFAKVFVKQYPNVWKVIRKMKKSDKLPHLMMKFESRLFRSILSECFKRGWKVVSIHDAIIVPNVEVNSCIDLDKLKNLMITTYNKYNLSPNISVDVFE